MKILIIGSKGFIGSAAYRYFSKIYGQENVFAADVVTEYNDANYFRIDATNSDFKNIFKKQKFAWCINASGAASVPESLTNPLRDYTLNTHNVALILDAIKEECSDCRFIQLSSAAVYGNPENLPISENSKLSPQSPYGLHKKQAEELCELYSKSFNIKCSILRIFSAYGPGLKKQLLWDIYKKSQADEIELFGTGKESRDFIYIDDLIQAIEHIIRRSKKNFDIYNIANGEQSTIESIATILTNILCDEKKLIFNKRTRLGDPLKWQADISKIKELGYVKTIPIEEGIQKYISWLKENE